MAGSPQSDPTESIQGPSDSRILAEGHQKSDLRPERIGPYRILDELGEGGMGVVYLAEQDKPIHRRVALKVIKLGMDTKHVIARFETEREALALMSHPNVARVFDAGATEDGRPYFAMEHVPGPRITDFCDAQRLTTEERLHLFTDVCDAVQHAHQKGIIHRDIKPNNVLVTVRDDKPVVKVIDFGVAKAMQHRLTEHTLFTEQGQLIGTPGYMSPEQADVTGLDVDTRTDIYSLGVLLYELLVGARPFDEKVLRQAGITEIQRIIRENDPPKPSTKLSSMKDERTKGHRDESSDPAVSAADKPPSLPRGDLGGLLLEPRTHGKRSASTGGSSIDDIAHRRHTDPKTLIRRIRGDLDWIVMKCLEKDRTRRYATANGLALEIERYLRHEPVLAGPPGAMYRLRKFVRRNRAAVLAASFMILVVGAGTAAVSWQEVRARRADAIAARASAYRIVLEALTATADLDDPRRSTDELATLTAKVIADCARAIDLEPELALAYAVRAKMFSRERKDEAAWHDCTRSLELEPTNSLALRTLGYLRFRRGDFQGALDAYERGIRALVSMDLPEDFHNRARLHQMSGDYRLALADRDRAVALAPQVGHVYAGRGITRRFLADIDDAIADLTRAAELDPKWGVQANLWIWEMRMLRNDPGDRESSEIALHAAQSARTDPLEDTYIQICRGRMSADQALATTTDPKYLGYAYYYLGARALVEGRNQEAKTFFQRCRDLGRHTTYEYELARWHLHRLGGE